MGSTDAGPEACRQSLTAGEDNRDLRAGRSEWGRWGGEGFAFVIQSVSSDAIGCGASGIGFADDTWRGCSSGIRSSLAIEFDSYFNVTSYELNGRRDNPNVTVAYNYDYV